MEVDKNNTTVLILGETVTNYISIYQCLNRLGYSVQFQSLKENSINSIKKIEKDFILLLDFTFFYEMESDFKESMAGCCKKIPTIIMADEMGKELISELTKYEICEYLIKDAHFLDLLPFTISKILKFIGQKQYGETFKQGKEKVSIMNDEIETVKALIEFMSDAVFITTLEGDFISVNGAAVKMLGFSQEKELIGRISREFVKAEDLNIFIERENQLLQGIKILPMVYYKIIRRDGTIIDTEVVATYIKYNEQNCVLSIIRDITERKRMETELKESEERYRTLVDLSPNLIAIYGNEKIEFINEAGIRILGGKSASDIIERPLLDFIYLDKEMNIVSENEFSMLRKRKKSTFLQVACKKVTGESIKMEASIFPFTYKGEKASYIVAQDITERNEAEELKRRAAESHKLLNEAVEYDKLKTEFFANISHELRTPLNVLLSTIQLISLYLKKDLILDKDGCLEKRLHAMKQNCFRLLRLVNNLIDITKIDSGFFEIQLQNLDIINSIEEITLSVVDYAENKSITLLFDTDVEEKIIAFDADKIERIMLNLLSNAVKFTEPGGQIIVNICDKEDYILISVKDTGKGIPVEKKEIVFERFRQVDKSLSRNHEGSGIGLSLVKSLIEMLEGKIWVESVEGEGSEFIIELPVSLVAEESKITSKSMGNGCIEKIIMEFSDVYS